MEDEVVGEGMVCCSCCCYSPIICWVTGLRKSFSKLLLEYVFVSAREGMVEERVCEEDCGRGLEGVKETETERSDESRE